MTDSCDKMEEQTEIIITSETEGKRLDAVLAEKTDGLSRSFLQKLFEEGKVFRNGKLCSKKEKGVEGDCILVNGNVLHSTKCTAPNTAILLQIPLDFMAKYIPDLGQLIFLWDHRTEDPVKKTKLMMLKTTLEQLQVINDIRPDGYLLRFNSLIFELLFQLYHNFSVKVFHQNINQRQKEMDRLDPVLNYIAEHYKEPISLDEIADIACLQTGYFCRFFKKKMGVTFLEYQNEYRLSFIYKDLITTKDPVHAILERHGFTNYKLFRRMFLEQFGDTPTKIRKQRESL